MTFAIGIDDKQIVLCGNCLNPSIKPTKCGFCPIAYCSPKCKETASKAHQVLCGKKNAWQNPVIHLDSFACTYLSQGGQIALSQRMLFGLTGRFRISGPIDSETERMGCKINPLLETSKLVLFKRNRFGFGVKTAVKINEVDQVLGMHGGIYSKVMGTSLKDHNNSISAEKGIFNAAFIFDLGAFAKDGPPNCHNYSIGGKIFVLNLKSLDKNAELFIDYGPQHIAKTSKYEISEASYAELKYLIQTKWLVFNDSADRHQFALTQYVIGTPPVLFRLILEGVLPLEGTKKILKQLVGVECLVPEMDSRERIDSIFSSLGSLKEKLFANYGTQIYFEPDNYYITDTSYADIRHRIKQEGLNFNNKINPDQYLLTCNVLRRPVALFRLLLEDVLPLDETKKRLNKWVKKGVCPDYLDSEETINQTFQNLASFKKQLSHYEQHHLNEIITNSLSKYYISDECYRDIKWLIQKNGLTFNPSKDPAQYHLTLYAVTTPIVLFRLLLEGVLPLENTKNILQTLVPKELWISEMDSDDKLNQIFAHIARFKTQEALLKEISVSSFLILTQQFMPGFQNFSSYEKLLPFGKILDHLSEFIMGNFANYDDQVSDKEEVLNRICPKDKFLHFEDRIYKKVVKLNDQSIFRGLVTYIQSIQLKYSDTNHSYIADRILVLRMIKTKIVLFNCFNFANKKK